MLWSDSFTGKQVCFGSVSGRVVLCDRVKKSEWLGVFPLFDQFINKEEDSLCIRSKK